jgi:hypothetical protein
VLSRTFATTGSPKGVIGPVHTEVRSGVPVFLEGGKTHRIGYADILDKLEPLNEGRDEGDRITYSSLWIHAKRHDDTAGLAAYWRTRVVKELTNALGGVRTAIE